MLGPVPATLLPKCTFAEIATATPMGQQAYESSVQAALIAEHSREFEFRRIRVGSLRSTVPAERRVPHGALNRGGLAFATAIGRFTYPRSDLVHLFDLRLPPPPGRHVVTAHDLPPMRFEDEGSVPRFLGPSARRAHAVIVPSEFARSEIIELLHVAPERVHVIPYGLTRVYEAPPEVPGDARLRDVEGPFVVHAAGATARKNLKALGAAWRTVAAARPDVRLVLCGPDDPRRTQIFCRLERTRLLGRVSPADVAWLMHRAAAVVVPSIYEGFGLPALEGMAAGVPVVAADAGALPEVCRDAAVLVPPTARGVADGLLRVLADRDLAADLRRKGLARAREFSWSVAAQRHAEVYQLVLDR